jgi:hypothetical protein
MTDSQTVGGHLRIVFLFAICTATSAFSSDYSASLYSENSYLSRESAAISQVRIRTSAKLSTLFEPYLQVGQELAYTGGAVASVESASSFVYGAPGISAEVGRVKFFSELRFRKYYQQIDLPSEGQGPIDFRILAVYGDYFAKRISPTLSTDLFSEIYSEGVFTSADLNNVVVAGFGRFGVRISPLPKSYVDLFLETFATVDRLGHFYYNHADLRPTLRLQYASDVFSVGLSVSYIATYFFPFANFDPNPYAGQPSSSRVMLVVGGTL